ncbi:tetratricopeptide repeat protein [Spiribacter insolitus]|uniref:Tetratricopeptide repeat protein n=1 Tax=Spiribacter insolitus TaxID=3122417 RepID=A0ABV3T5Z2_9GAMM
MSIHWSIPALTITALLLGMSPVALAQSENLERAPSETASDERALTLYHEGKRAMETGDLATGARHFREALSLDDRLQPARRDYARILMAAGRPDRAQAVLALGLELSPRDGATARMLARVARENGDLDLAIRALESIRPDTDAEETTLRANLATLYQATGNYSQAASLYAELRTVEPAAPRWILGEALALDYAGVTTDAAFAWSALIAHDEIDPSVRRYAEARIAALRDAQVPYGD